MINPGHAREVAGVVAILTGIEAVDVDNRFTDRNRAIVTTRTIACDARMIEDGARKTIGIVAVITGITALDMARVFAKRHRTIMTAGTGTLH